MNESLDSHTNLGILYGEILLRISLMLRDVQRLLAQYTYIIILSMVVLIRYSDEEFSSPFFIICS